LKRLVSGIILALLLTCLFTLLLRLQIGRAQPSTITVPDDYATIQEAVNHASDGDTVFVKSGTYRENGIAVDKSISLIGQDRETTIIDAGSIAHVLVINADNVVVEGFIVRNGFYACWVFGSNCWISDNNFINDDSGAEIRGRNDTFTNNVCIGSTGAAITIFVNDSNTVTSNIVKNGKFVGIYIFEGSNNTIMKNEITDNLDMGIIIDVLSSNNVVSQNNISRNGLTPSQLWNSGIVIHLNSNSNKIVNNFILNNQIGLWQGFDCNDNLVSHNSFINNNVQVHNDPNHPCSSIWDDGYPSGGNCWSDYGGTDLHSGPYQNVTGSDGLGDTSYVIDANNNTDHYPLMKPYALSIGDVNKDGKVDMIDIGIVALSFGSSPGDLRWNLLADVNQDGKVDLRDIGLVARHFGDHV
jgi:parallel beta-helix repeat protein